MGDHTDSNTGMIAGTNGEVDGETDAGPNGRTDSETGQSAAMSSTAMNSTAMSMSAADALFGTTGQSARAPPRLTLNATDFDNGLDPVEVGVASMRLVWTSCCRVQPEQRETAQAVLDRLALGV